MMHEYIHSLGIMDENEVRQLVYEITQKAFGKSHLATQIAFNLEKFIPNMTFGDFEAPEDLSIEFIPGIDRDNTDYIM